MKMIAIKERQRPFSHLPGTGCLLPGTHLAVRLFPARLEVHDLLRAEIEAFDLPIEGPVEGFTALLDLEKGRVSVWGTGQNGFFRFHIGAEGNDAVIVTIEKDRSGNLAGCFAGRRVREGDHFSQPANPTERLSLGSHKKQDWPQVTQRNALAEVLPTWLKAGQMAPTHREPREGTAELLDRIEEAIATRDRVAVGALFLQLHRVGFSGILQPRGYDADYQGLVAGGEGLTGLQLLSEGARLMRSLFIQESDGAIDILPLLPVDAHCGRFVGVTTSVGTVDIEWSKKAIRRMVFYSAIDGSVPFRFQKGIRQFRVRSDGDTAEQQVLAGEKFEVVKGGRYRLDHFTR